MKSAPILPTFTCPKECKSCTPDPTTGFSFKTVAKGEKFLIPPKRTLHHILFVIKGRFTLNSNECKNYLVRRDEMIFCYKEYAYEITALVDLEIVFANFITAGQACDMTTPKWIKEMLPTIQYQFESVKINKPLKDFLSSLMLFLSNDINCRYMHQAKVIDLFTVFRFFYPADVGLKMFYNTFDNTVSFKSLVTHNQPRSKTVDELAEFCGYGLTTFKTIFAQHFDVTPYVWMQQQNAIPIRQMIINPEIPYKTIIKEFGFASHGHLIRYCKQYLDGSPADIRAKI